MEGKSCCSNPKKGKKSDQNTFENWVTIGLVIVGILVIFNQVQVSAVSSTFDTMVGGATGSSIFFRSSGEADLSGVDVTTITSTPMAVASVFPELRDMKNQDQIMGFMIPTGTPEYSSLLGGISFDDPVMSMEYLAKLFPSLLQEVKSSDPATFQRYVDLASNPRGVSCEYCCGLGATGARKDGQSMCGCKHNPALLALSLSLMKNTDYSDAEVLREVMKWKTMFFPKNMVGVAMKVAGTNPSALKELPGMVGGC